MLVPDLRQKLLERQSIDPALSRLTHLDDGFKRRGLIRPRAHGVDASAGGGAGDREYVFFARQGIRYLRRQLLETATEVLRRR